LTNLKTRTWQILSLFTILSIPLNFPSLAAPLEKSRLIPEFAPTKAVVLSQYLFDADYKAQEIIKAIIESGSEVWIALDQRSKIEDKIKARLREAGLSAPIMSHIRFFHLNHSNIWLRDFGPIPAMKWTNSERSGASLFVDAQYRDFISSSNDRVPQQMGRHLKIPVVAMPFDLDGGNLLVSESSCFTSHMLGSPPFSADLKKFFDKVGCKIFKDIDDAPHVHIDMWMKIVSNEMAFVHEIQPETLALAAKYYGGIPPDLMKLRDNLDKKAEELKTNFKIERLPLPLPFRNVFRTYTNALLVNGRAIIPNYRQFGWSHEEYPDSSLNLFYESQVEKIFRRSGFSVHWVPGDALIFNGGAFRCASFQIPEMKSYQKRGF
jgi:agmatine/peptidylarginine deiminase